MSVKEMNIVFNTNRTLYQYSLEGLYEDFNEAKLTSPQIIAYDYNELEVVISDIGMVSITPNQELNSGLQSFIDDSLEEYKKLQSKSDIFSRNKSFKLIVPSLKNNEISNELNTMNFDYSLTEQGKKSTFSVIT